MACILSMDVLIFVGNYLVRSWYKTKRSSKRKVDSEGMENGLRTRVRQARGKHSSAAEI